MNFGFVHLGRENLGVEYLSSVLKEAGHKTRLYYDPGLFGPNDNVFAIPALERRFSRFRSLVGAILKDSPDILAFSIYTNTYQWSLSILAALRRGGYSGRVLFGGIHATLVPERVLFDTGADAVVIGESEAIIEELAQALQGGEPLDQVGNILFMDGEAPVRTPMREAIRDLDTIPFPDKGLFEGEINFRDDYLIMTGRGCPLSCSFCCESSMNRLYRNRYFRRRAPEAVIDELVAMRRRYDFREVMINDAMIFTSIPWLQDFLARYRRRIRLPFRCFAYPKFMTRAMVEELKGSGCYCVEFGLQTTNEKIRRDVLNRRESNEEAASAFRICDQVGLRYDIDHIFGLPGEDEEDFRDAARLYAGLKRLNRIKCHLLSYFPATPLVERALREGWISREENEKIAGGEIGDFFHAPTVNDPEAMERIRDFSRLFKFLPLLPTRVVAAILNHNWNRIIGKIPGPGIIILQVLGAVKGRDYRFWLYIKYYTHRLARHFLLRRSVHPGENSKTTLRWFST